MAFLYITEQNAVLRKTGRRIVVEKNGQEIFEIKSFNIDAICLFGNVQFTTQAATLLLSQKIELALFTLTGRLKGQLTPPFPKNILLRKKQYYYAHQKSFSLNLSRTIIKNKILNSSRVLYQYHRNHPQPVLANIVKNLKNMAKKIEKVTDLNSLRGLEGQAASLYFSALTKMFDKKWQFFGRKRRPATDPVNALLSFGYVLISNEIAAMLDGVGFDPYLGFYHQTRYGRFSLALDILEMFRAPLVDRLVLRLLHLERLKENYFSRAENSAIYLNRNGLKSFFAAFEAWMIKPVSQYDQFPFRDKIRQQVDELRNSLVNDTQFRGFLY
ncbi:CRISPR-associated endonuclease Cas1 [candidate division KSB1 bacterium]|nr:CRISPR-associated endonuclease Cas1 [candidate division KSB1 bacterium]